MDQGIPSNVWNCRIDTSGRIVIPHSLRLEKCLKSGDEISICKVGEEFVIRKSDETLEQLLAAFRSGIPEGLSLADELMAERKMEASREEVGH